MKTVLRDLTIEQLAIALTGEPRLPMNEVLDECRRRQRILDAAADCNTALKRLLRAFEADYEMVPTIDVRTSWETNSQAVSVARAALAAYAKAKEPSRD